MLKINPLDFEMKLLHGSPIHLSDTPIYSVTLSEALNTLGYTKYNKLTNILCIDDEKVKPYVSELIKEN
jgi:hypothetical protein